MTKWISVNDKMPQIRVDVLTWDGEFFNISELYEYHSSKKIAWYGMTGYEVYPTHWMPLPDAPEQENE